MYQAQQQFNKVAITIFWIFFALVCIGWSVAKADTGTVDSVSQYIDLKNCDNQDRLFYTVCWDAERRVPVSGWTEIKGNLIDVGNTKARPSFYKDKIVKTISPSLVNLPNHLGHTFANDSDNDYSVESLKSTYNMINITPMLGQLNIGMWRKVENRGKEIARKYGSVMSITLVEYFPDKKYNLVYPKKYTRIYSIPEVGFEECYSAENKLISAPLNTIQIDCKGIKIQ